MENVVHGRLNYIFTYFAKEGQKSNVQMCLLAATLNTYNVEIVILILVEPVFLTVRLLTEVNLVICQDSVAQQQFKVLYKFTIEIQIVTFIYSSEIVLVKLLLLNVWSIAHTNMAEGHF